MRYLTSKSLKKKDYLIIYFLQFLNFTDSNFFKFASWHILTKWSEFSDAHAHLMVSVFDTWELIFY
jgi:hypothetical protein